MNSLEIIVLLTFSILIMLIIVPITKKIAKKTNIVDHPGGRKEHVGIIPLLGGVAIFIGINFINYLMRGIINETILDQLFIGSFLILLLGTIDDVIDMNAVVKLFFQIVIAIYVSFSLGGMQGVEIYSFHLEFNNITGIIIQAVWFVVLMNAFNLIDGLDGLATGSGIISLGTIVIVASLQNKIGDIGIYLIIIGVLMGFLYFNFSPASIFLGDGGSMLIGFYVATLSTVGYKTVTFTTMMVILLVAFLPVFDTILAFVRRKVNGQSPFKADALHFHHRLIRKGYSRKNSVLLIYAIMIFYSLSSVIISFGSISVKIIILIFLIVGSIFIVEKFYLLSDRYAYISKILRRIFKIK